MQGFGSVAGVCVPHPFLDFSCEGGFDLLALTTCTSSWLRFPVIDERLGLWQMRAQQQCY